MSYQCFPAELSELIPIITKNLASGEQLLWLCQDNYPEGQRANGFSLGRGASVISKPADTQQINPKVWKRNLLIVVILLVGMMALLLTLQVKHHSLHSFKELFACGILIVVLIVVLLSPSMVTGQKVYAFTNKRLICFAPFSLKMIWWFDLNKLTAVNIQTTAKGTKDLILSFSSGPMRNYGFGLKPPIKQWAIIGVVEAEQLQSLLLTLKD